MYAIKVELKLNNREKTLMNQHIGFSRFVYNYSLSIYNQIDHQEFLGGTAKKRNCLARLGVQGFKGCLLVSSTKTKLFI